MSCNKDQQRQIRKQSLNRIKPLLNKLKYIQNIHVIQKQQTSLKDKFKKMNTMIFSQKTEEKYRQYINEQKKKLVTLEKGQPPTS